MLTLKQKIKANLTSIIMWILVLGIACTPFFLKPPREHTETRTQQVQTQIIQEVETKTTETKEQTKQEAKQKEKAKQKTYTGTSTKNTKTTTRKTTTNYAPDGTVIQTIEEETTTEELASKEAKAETKEESKIDTTVTNTVHTQTEQTAEIKTDEKVEIQETEVIVDKPAASKKSKLGAAVTTAGRPAVTYDLYKLSRIAVQGLGEIDIQEKKLGGLGAGLAADIDSDGDYFAGVHGKYDFVKKEPQVGAHIGMRF